MMCLPEPTDAHVEAAYKVFRSSWGDGRALIREILNAAWRVETCKWEQRYSQVLRDLNEAQDRLGDLMSAADDYANLARRAQAAQELTPGEWVAGDGWVYTPPVYDDDHRLANVLGMKHADRDRANAEHARAQRNAEFIAAANPATILRLIEDLREAQMERADLLIERDALAARLAAIEALADETEQAGDPLLRLDRLRAALSAAPIDITKEN